MSVSLCCRLFDVWGRQHRAPVLSMRGWRWWWWWGVVSRQLAWASTHLSLLLLPALLCQTLLLQINKCWTNSSLFNLCRLLHNNEGCCCQRMCPASNDPPVWEDNEEGMYSCGRTPLLLCTFFSPGLSWLWHRNAFVNTVVQQLGTIIPVCRSDTEPRASFLFYFILAMTYHSTDSDITTLRLSVCLPERLLILNCSRVRINLSTTWQSAKCEWCFVRDQPGLHRGSLLIKKQ